MAAVSDAMCSNLLHDEGSTIPGISTLDKTTNINTEILLLLTMMEIFRLMEVSLMSSANFVTCDVITAFRR
eukprot:CAMPEP_0197238640 /NCGR_PEP_ID=MMETSP1429-20130617/5161_1 /TAXON_ID=49237 /ORGANISM="Chaetoceros  sp., Strain UNC1202" /LENGTH=70 /DNA_ID=CAMNT_0042697857 /DNA_START=103 /DNA_END=312 /DNA_ORIENTATION=-